MSSPNHDYFRACEGSWACRFSVEVTDFTALRRAVGLLNAGGLALLARWPGFLGTPRFRTSVAYDPSGQVVHTTRISWLGLPLARSREVLELDVDGRGVTFLGEFRFLMAPWRVERVEAVGEVDETASRASYTIQFLGAEMAQSAERLADRVTLTQTLPGYRAVQRLERVTPVTSPPP